VGLPCSGVLDKKARNVVCNARAPCSVGWFVLAFFYSSVCRKRKERNKEEIVCGYISPCLHCYGRVLGGVGTV